ncbi:MAG TPA: plastocyanin/azurin family copper-binding protein [Kofleriaceae bacterium]|nr:plastocyanin/azurin family copper-binding protein [Kofleriaceae bacterium]
MKRFAVALVMLAACGGDDGSTPMPDAPNMTTNKVQTVTCPTTADATVMTTAAVDAYMPATQTVPKNAVVKFVMASTHDVAPNTIGTSDPGLVVGFGATKCLKFTETGTFGFFCSAHSFAGTITVQ